MGREIFLSTLMSVFICWCSCYASIPHQISYQGQLTGPSGEPLSGFYDFEFGIFDAETGGMQLWDESHAGVNVNDGLFSIMLGSATPIDLSFDGTYWLEIIVGGETLTPRMSLSSVGTAYKAENSEHLEGQSISDLDGRYVNEDQSGSITSDMIVNNTIDETDMGFMRWGEWWARYDDVIIDVPNEFKVYLVDGSDSIHILNQSDEHFVFGHSAFKNNATQNINRGVIMPGNTYSFDVDMYADISLNIAEVYGQWTFFFKGIYRGSSNGALIVGYYNLFNSAPLGDKGKQDAEQILDYDSGIVVSQEGEVYGGRYTP